ncbi:hypothetical protein F4781DRAFT_139490 [Annulohypoxylon bovei var. microspora]|nr:hypothetical protein F4781DRAFT_139490 [Annulohypoxylon bovei var. microspora]
MSANASPDPAAAAAAAAAARAGTIRLWTLYSFGVSVTILRTYARIKAIGARNLQADDILVWVAILFYSAQTALAQNVSAVAQGLANNGMTDVQRATLSLSDPEYQMRVIGSKIQMAGWATYAALMCFLKLSVLSFYIRLTQGLHRRYGLQIRIGFILVIGTSLASILAVLCGCSPFYRNWQIDPDPGNQCQPAISRPIIWTSFTANASTDIYLILIPIPMLWGSSLRLMKKVASSVVLGAGIFVLVCAMLKTIFVTTYPVNGAELAGEWGTIEAFVAVFTTNLPMIFPLFKAWLKPVFGDSSKPYVKRSGFNTIGGGGGSGSGGSASRKRYMGGPPSVNPLTTLGNDSLENMVHGISLQELEVTGASAAPGHPRDAVYVSKQVDVTSQHGDVKNERLGV